MSDPVLEYLKSVKQDLREIKQDLGGMLQKHDDRLDTLEDAQSEQRGMIKMAGAVITAASGVVAFIVAHLKS
jgi:hypothetical protein